MAAHKINREEVAKREIGTTLVSAAAARLLTLCFLATVFLVPLGQRLIDRGAAPPAFAYSPAGRGEGESLFSLVDRNNTAVLKAINSLEGDLEEGSFLRRLFLPPLQYVMLHLLGKGNEKAVPGLEGTLHYAPDLDALLGPPFLHPQQLRERAAGHKLWEKAVHPDPLPAIESFAWQLADRGIRLIVLPVPARAALEPRSLSRRDASAPLANRSLGEMMAKLSAKGILVFDARPTLSRYAREHGSAYLATDTHWLPGAMQAVAEDMAGFIEAKVEGLSTAASYVAEEEKVRGVGDIARMLTLPAGVEVHAPEEVSVRRIFSARQELWLPDKNAEVLLLGDSFTNIYASEGLGWKSGAGLAEQLAYHLQRPVDLLARNDGGAYVTREMLAAELARGHDRLEAKKVVIWQFAERELALGDWKPVELRLGQPVEGRYYVVPPGSTVTVSATLAAISPSARPGTVPYRDAVLTLHLVDLETAQGKTAEGQAVVYGFGMRDNVLTPLAAQRPGDRVTLRLRPWEEVEGEYGSYRRTPLDDDLLELEIPNWGELSDETK